MGDKANKRNVYLKMKSLPEARQLVHELSKIHDQALQGKLELGAGVEDIHTRVEMLLTEKLGEAGKKIHTGRSRNDQVMVDIILYLREEIKEVTGQTYALAKILCRQAEKYKEITEKIRKIAGNMNLSRTTEF